MSATRTVAQVLLDTSLPQLDHLFDYLVPDALRDAVAVGQRVKVPLRAGARQSFGYVVALSDQSEYLGQLSELSDIVSPVSMLQPNVWQLARTLADRAAGNANDILRLAIPVRQVRVEKTYLAQREQLASQITQAIQPGITASGREPKRYTVQSNQPPQRLESGEWVSGWVTELTEIAVAVASNEESVIVVVPDRYDLEQAFSALNSTAFASRVIRVDSLQSNAARYLGFLRTLEHEPKIILGNRSAVYAAAFSLGAIVMFDDGDALLDEPLKPYVHARDAALQRSELEHCDLVFIAPSRSLAVHRLTRIGYLTEQGDKAVVRHVLLSASVLGEGQQGRLPTVARQAVLTGLESGPVLIQVPSPGNATAVFCRECGERQRCSECAGPLQLVSTPTPHKRCRWCAATSSDASCSACQSTAFREVGAGSERTAEQFEQQFPAVRVMRSDGDERKVLVDSRPAIVVATRGAEPVAAGGYSAVLLLDADRMLAAESLHAEEEALRVWSNATSLARRDAEIVLTKASGSLAQNFALGTPDRWLDVVLAERKQLRYPPAVRVATVSGSAADVSQAVKALDGIAGVDILPEHRVRAGNVETVVRFDYRVGAEVASLLKTALIAHATISRRRSGDARSGRAVATLKLHFDDRSAFDERGGRR